MKKLTGSILIIPAIYAQFKTQKDEDNSKSPALFTRMPGRIGETEKIAVHDKYFNTVDATLRPAFKSTLRGT